MGPYHCMCMSAAGDPVPTGCKYTQKEELGHASFIAECEACARGWRDTAVFGDSEVSTSPWGESSR